MAEFGLFNDEGCVEGGFFSREEAQEAIESRYEAEDELRIAEVCPDHEGQERASCEECNAEEEGEDE